MSSGAEWPERVSIVGTPISVTSYDELLELLDRRPIDRAATIAFCNVHSVMTARRRPDVATALAQADVATSDGMPLVWGLRAFGYPDQPRVYGPAFMEIALKQSVEAGWSHFFYGSTDETLAKLVAAAEELAPGVRIAGSYSPPFRPFTDDDLQADAARITRIRCRPGLGGVGHAQAGALDGDGRPPIYPARLYSGSEPHLISWPGPCPRPRCGCSPPGWSGSTGSLRNPGGCGDGTSSTTPTTSCSWGATSSETDSHERVESDATAFGLAFERWPLCSG